jgi:hypothetical protein
MGLAARTIKPTRPRILSIGILRALPKVRLVSRLLVTQCRLEIPYRPFPSYRKHANATACITHQLMATDAIGFWNWGERCIRLPSQRRRQIRWVDLPPRAVFQLDDVALGVRSDFHGFHDRAPQIKGPGAGGRRGL